MAVNVTGLAAALGIASESVTAYLRCGTAPEPIHEETIIRTAGHVRARRGFGVVEGPMQAGGAKWRMAPVCRQSDPPSPAPPRCWRRT